MPPRLSQHCSMRYVRNVHENSYISIYGQEDVLHSLQDHSCTSNNEATSKVGKRRKRKAGVGYESESILARNALYRFIVICGEMYFLSRRLDFLVFFTRDNQKMLNEEKGSAEKGSTEDSNNGLDEVVEKEETSGLDDASGIGGNNEIDDAGGNDEASGIDIASEIDKHFYLTINKSPRWQAAQPQIHCGAKVSDLPSQILQAKFTEVD